MGRGSALNWYAGNRHFELYNLSTRRLRRVARLYDRSNKNIILSWVNFLSKHVMNPDLLSKFQLYLWSWREVEIRIRRFIRQNNIKKYFEPSSVDMFDHKNFFNAWFFLNNASPAFRLCERVTRKFKRASQLWSNENHSKKAWMSFMCL